MDYSYYISLQQSLQQTNSVELTQSDRITIGITYAVVLIIILAFAIIAFDIPGKFNERKVKHNRDEQQVLCAIANASEKSADAYQPGATIADIVIATNLSVANVKRIVDKFKRDEIVKVGQNDNGNKIYFV